MPYAKQLKTAFKTSKIDKIAIIDDAYDAPEFGQLTGTAFTAAATALRELKADEPGSAEVSAIEAALGRSLPISQEDLRDPAMLEKLWALYWDAAPDALVRKPLQRLFRDMERKKRDKLRPLDALAAILKKTTGVTADTLHSATTATQALAYDLVFLDFFLGDEVPADPDASVTARAKAEAKRRSIDFLKAVVEAADKQDEFKTPLVMLISSLAHADDLPEFRQAAGMLASKMAFMSKRFVEDDPDRAQHAMAGLARHRQQADALWRFLSIWKKTVNMATDEMMTSLRELDLTDYSYIQEYRLSVEKTPLSQYAASLFSGRLTDLVEQKMQAQDALRHMGEAQIDTAIPGRVSPTKAITEIYSSITTSRVPVAEGDFQPRAWAGDIFLETAKYNEIFGKALPVKKTPKGYPRVLAVVTPACDLIPDRSQGNPLLTVTMVGGELLPLADAYGPTTNLIMLNEQPFVINWNTKWPMTSALASMSPGSAFAGRYQWVGRLRDLYHAELQHKLFTDVGRVGLPTPPTMPEFVPARVLVKTGRGGGKFELFRDFAADSESAWGFASKKDKRDYCLREDLAWEIKAWVAGLSGQIADAAFTKLNDWTQNPKWLEELQHPVTFKANSDRCANAGTGVTYRRVDKAFDFVGTNEQTAFIVVFGRPAGQSTVDELPKEGPAAA